MEKHFWKRTEFSVGLGEVCRMRVQLAVRFKVTLEMKLESCFVIKWLTFSFKGRHGGRDAASINV